MSSLKVNGLTYRTIEREVEELFERYGKIGEVFIPKDRFSRKSRGFAFVRFYEKRDADRALKAVDGKIFDGRKLTIERARNDGGGGGEAGAGGSGQGVGEGRRQVRGAGQGLAAEKVKEGDRPGRPVRKIEGGGRPVKRGGGLPVRRGGSLPVRGGGLLVRRINLNIPEVKKADMQYRTGGPGRGAVRGRGWCVLIQIGRRTLFDLRLMYY